MEERITLEEMSYELEVVMQAMLLFAGVKKEKLEEAVDEYIEIIGEVDETNQEAGDVELVQIAVNELKRRKKSWFNG